MRALILARDFTMKPMITGQKRPLESSLGNEEQASKRFRISREALEAATILSSLDDPHSRDLSPITQEALRTVNASLQRGYPLLDLSGLSATQVEDLPPGLINPSIHSIQTLLLPPGLKRLPSFCRQLVNVQYLDLPDFAGEALDLTGLRSLRRLNGSASEVFDHLFVNILVDLHFKVPDTESKIHVYRYDGDQLLKQHALPSHPYFKVLPGNQKADHRSFNCVSFFQGTNTLICCDTIAPEILHRRLSPRAAEWKKIGYFGVTDADSLSQSIPSHKNSAYTKALLNSDSYAFVDDSGFGPWIKAQFSGLLANKGLSFSNSSGDKLKLGVRVFSTNHELFCLLIAKPGPVPEFIVEIYDPNLTRTHKRMVANRLEQIIDPKAPWRLSDFLCAPALCKYMRGNASALLCFAGLGQRKGKQSPKTEFWINETQLHHPDVMFTLLDMDLSATIRPYWNTIIDQYKQKKFTLSALFQVLVCHSQSAATAPENSPPNNMIYDNKSENCKEFITCIEEFAEILSGTSLAERCTLPTDSVKQLLQPVACWSQMIIDIANSEKDSLQMYFILATSLLKKRQIAAKDVISLLTSKNSEGASALTAALTMNDAKSPRYLGELLKILVDHGELKFRDALGLIDADAMSGITDAPVVWSVCATASPEMMTVLSDLLIDLGKHALASQPGFMRSFTYEDCLNEPELRPVSLTRSDIYLSHPSFTDSAKAAQEQDVQGMLRNLLFGKISPTLMPSVVSSRRSVDTMLVNLRQLVKTLEGHALLSPFGEMGQFLTITEI